jgi:hypothetical protein
MAIMGAGAARFDVQYHVAYYLAQTCTNKFHSLLRFVNTYSSSIVRVGLPHVLLGVCFQLIMLCFSVYPLQAVSHMYWVPLFPLIDDFYRDMPPAGGFEALRYKRNLPLRGPSGLAILGGVTALCAYGFYRVGMGNIEKRWVLTRKQACANRFGLRNGKRVK